MSACVGKEAEYWERLKGCSLLEVRSVVLLEVGPIEHCPVPVWGVTAITLVILKCYIFVYKCQHLFWLA